MIGCFCHADVLRNHWLLKGYSENVDHLIGLPILALSKMHCVMSNSSVDW